MSMVKKAINIVINSLNGMDFTIAFIGNTHNSSYFLKWNMEKGYGKANCQKEDNYEGSLREKQFRVSVIYIRSPPDQDSKQHKVHLQ